MFEYQTAISELTGPAGVQRVGVRGALGGRRGRLSGQAAQRAAPVRRQRAACTRTRSRRSARYAHGYGMEVVEVPLRDGVTDPEAWAQAIDADTSAAIFAQPNFYGAVEDAAALSAAAKAPPAARGAGAAVAASRRRLPGRSDHARHPQAPRRVRRRRGRRRGPAARQPPRLRRPLLRPVRRPRGVPAADARADRRRDRRRGRAARVRAHAADPRAAHPPREGDLEHLHRAGAQRARRASSTWRGSGRRGIVELGELLLARTHYARETLAGLEGVEKLHDQPVIREFALRLDADVAAVRPPLRASRASTRASTCTR